MIEFDVNSSHFQSLATYKIRAPFLNITFTFGLDGISLFFLVLSSFLIFLCILFVWEEPLLKEYTLTLLLIDLLLLLVLLALDAMIFYIFFEVILIPIYLMIGVWGSRERKIRAVYLFFFYTLFVLLLMLVVLMYIYPITGTLDLKYLVKWPFTFTQQGLLCLAFFMSIASKSLHLFYTLLLIADVVTTIRTQDKK
jgi:NADH:ubiquinone oxidoreductase subunit 4 (subunit M)